MLKLELGARAETAVNVRGSGVDGRNQEVALAASVGTRDTTRRTVIASIGTDGEDGQTDAARAIVDQDAIKRASKRNMDAKAFLAEDNPHAFSKALGDLTITGPTGANVNDIMIVW